MSLEVKPVQCCTAALAGMCMIAHAPSAHAQDAALPRTATIAHTQTPPDVHRAQKRVNRANWALANRFSPTALKPFVYTDVVRPHWLGETDSLWYNWRDSNGSHFYLVIPATGTKRALFDRERLAAQLAEQSGGPVDPHNLPFRTLHFTRDHKAFRFTSDSVRYEWNLTTQTLKRLGKPPREVPADEERDERERSLGVSRNNAAEGASGRGDYRNFSPDSTAFVFARAHNLYFVDVGNSDTLQITTDGELNHSFGYRDTTYNRRTLRALSQRQDDETGGDESEGNAAPGDMRVRPEVAWAPDSKAFAIVRSDQRKVKDLYLVNSLAEPRPTLLHYKYALPGEVNVPQAELWVYHRGDRSAKQLDVKRWKDQRIMDVHWPVGSEKVRLIRRDRLQRNLDFIEMDVATNAIRTLLTESIRNASLDPEPVRYVKKGGDFIWASPRSGWRHYYVYGFNGGAAPKHALTSGAWHADDLVEIDSTRGIVWVTGEGHEAGENPYYQHVYRVNADGTGLTILDPGDFTHDERFSPTKRYFVDSYSRSNAPTANVLRDAATGRIVMKLEAMDVTQLTGLGWKPPEPFTVKAADGVTDLYGNIYKPFDFDPSRKYPLIAHVYPGPQDEGVTYKFSAANVLQQMAQLGFIVIELGHRGGSPTRSVAYHRYGYHNARDYALADKKAGIEQLAARYPWIDIDRIGLQGHSGGGFLTATAMMLPPYNDFFKVGVAESGNYDNNIYNQNWGESNYGPRLTILQGARSDSSRSGPDAQQPSPALGANADTVTSSADSMRFDIHVPTTEELAGNLKGNLLIETGELDNNVHPANTMRLVNALIKANKRFDMLMIPGQPHSYRDMADYTNHLMMEYFAEHLLGDYYRSDAEIQ